MHYIDYIITTNYHFRMLTFLVTSRSSPCFFGGTPVSVVYPGRGVGPWVYPHCTFQSRGGRFKSPALGYSGHGFPP